MEVDVDVEVEVDVDVETSLSDLFFKNEYLINIIN